MIRRLSLFFGSTALAATLSLATTARADEPEIIAPVKPLVKPNGKPTCSYGPAVLSPVETGEAHGPGDVAARGDFFYGKATYIPYYASPLNPVSVRWCYTTCHGNILLVPYYPGYCFHRRKHRGYRYGTCGDCLAGPGGASGLTDMVGQTDYGLYSGGRQDEDVLKHLSGNGPGGPEYRPHFHDGVQGVTDPMQGGTCRPANCCRVCQGSVTPVAVPSFPPVGVPAGMQSPYPASLPPGGIPTDVRSADTASIPPGGVPMGIPSAASTSLPPGGVPVVTQTSTSASFPPGGMSTGARLTDNTSHLVLTVPENAEVLFEDNKTTRTGQVREFVSPPLPVGRVFDYTITVRYSDANGRVVTDKRVIHVQANDWFRIDFTRPAMTDQSPSM